MMVFCYYLIVHTQDGQEAGSVDSRLRIGCLNGKPINATTSYLTSGFLMNQPTLMLIVLSIALMALHLAGMMNTVAVQKNSYANSNKRTCLYF